MLVRNLARIDMECLSNTHLPPLSLPTPTPILGKSSPTRLCPLDNVADKKYSTPKQSPIQKKTQCTPCKRIRLESIPILELPAPFLNIHQCASFSTNFA